nr:RHS repeat-associated core domain-containing protein [Guopingia tenuis]
MTEQTYTNYGTAKTVNKAYEYDTVGRLTKSTIDGKATSYTYDAVGNRLTQTSEGKTLSYSYNNLNQLTSIKEGNTTVASYTYDANGNQKKETRQHVSVTVGGNTQVYNKETDYTYDLRGLLTGVSVKTPSANEITGEVTYDTQTTTNTYNAAGKRLKRVEEDKTTRFYYMGEALLFTTNQDLVMTSENVLNTGGQIIASKRFAVPGVEVTDPFAGQYYFYRYDVRGSVTDILDKNAGLVKGYDYDEFGNTEEKGNENFLNDVTFTGSVSDASSGLQYMNARFYQPSTGRFLSQDSYSGNPYDPWTQHLYSYCGNNPVNMVDPTGHSMKELELKLRLLKSQRNNAYSQIDRLRPLVTTSYNEKNYTMYNLYADSLYYYKKLVKSTEVAISLFEMTYYNQYKALQNDVTNGGTNLHQRKNAYKNLRFNNSTVGADGCGFIAAVKVDSLLGGEADVHDALAYFNEPGRNFPLTNAASEGAVRGYLTEKGYKQHSAAGAESLPNTIHIISYRWSFTEEERGEASWGRHFACYVVNPNGSITVYNGSALEKEFNDYDSFYEDSGIDRVYYNNYYTR